jgi:hypothetical protein
MIMLFNEEMRANALKIQEELHGIQGEFEKAYNGFMESVERFELSDPQFWAFVQKLTTGILRGYSVESACHNAFCGCSSDSFLVGLRSIKTIEYIKKELYNPLMDYHPGSDDGYGDFLDAVFLAGPNFIAKAFNADFYSTEEVQEMIKAEVGDKLFNIIWTGENYWRMKLEEKSKVWFNRLEPMKRNDDIEVEEDLSGKPWYERS